MASDLKMEIFAFKIFHKNWCDYEELQNEPDIIKTYGDECVGDNSYLEACDDVFYKAITARHCLLSNFYYLSADLVQDVQNFRSMSEVCDYIIDTCNKDELFGCLPVFERMLVTSDHVMNLCYMIYLEAGCLKDVLKYSHIFWAMYFDKFTEEFYENGGWNKLKIVSESYSLLTDLFDILGLKSLWGTLKSLKESELNYACFKRYLQQQKVVESERKQYVAMHWIRFNIAFFYGSAKMPFNYEDYATANEIHFLLEDVRFCCDSSLFDKVYGKEAIKVNSKECSLTEKTNTFENSLQVDNVLNNENSDVVEIDTTNNVDNAHFKKNIPTETEMTLEINLDVKMTVNSPHKQNDVNTHRETGENQKLPMIVDDDCASTLYVNKILECKNAEFYSSNIEEQIEIPTTAEIFSVKEKIEYECCTDVDSRSFCIPKDIAPQIECLNSGNKTINTKQECEGKSASKEQIENPKAKNIESVNQMAASTCDVTSVDKSDTMYYTADESNSIKKTREDLRKEQNDPEMQNFLRLILVLGDKQRLKSVLATSKGYKGSSVKLQKKSNKMKRSRNIES